MMIASPILYGSLTQVTVTSALSSMMTVTTGVVRDFFLNLWLRPEENFMAVMVVVVIVAAPIVGGAFLAKKAYEKYCPEN